MKIFQQQFLNKKSDIVGGCDRTASMHLGPGKEHFNKNFLTASTSKDVVLDLVSADLNAYLDQGDERQKRLNFLSRKIEIHKKTLQRIAAKQNSPSYPTIMKLYRFLYNVDSDIKVLQTVPEALKEFLNKSFPERGTPECELPEKNLKFLADNVVALEIFLLVSSKTLTKSDVISRFGVYGLSIVKQLIENQMVAEAGPDQYIQGSKNISLPPELLIKSGNILAQAFAKPQNCYMLFKNFVGFYTESLSEEAYQEWIKIDQEAMKKKIELAQRAESKGRIPAFNFCIVETLTNEDGQS